MEKRPRGRKLAGFFFLFLTTYLICEIASFLFYSATEGRVFSFKRISERRQLVLKAADAFVRDPNDPALAGERSHPYAGFISDPAISASSSLLDGARSQGAALTGGSVAAQLCGKAGMLCLAGQGYKQPQQLMLLTYLLSQGAKIGVLVNLDGFNELALPKVENIPKGIHPSYPRKWYFRTGSLYDGEALREVGSLVWLHETRSRLAAFSGGAPWRWSVTASALWAGADRLLARKENLIYSSFYGRPLREPDFEQTGPAYRAASEEGLYEDLARIWAQSSLQMHRLCEANGIRYFHFLQPNQYVPDSKPFSPEERLSAVARDSAYRVAVERGYPYLRREGERLRQLGVRFVDLTGLFKDEAETVYADSCCHLNAYGNERLENAIREVVGN